MARRLQLLSKITLTSLQDWVECVDLSECVLEGGKAKVIKVMEERSGGIGTSSGVGIEERMRGKNADGSPRVMDRRPKWMKEAVNCED
jgi:hypothetical protein